ncbi:hypothetical protein BH10ACI2_BH10ACI2_02050 [soil metagenome]
MKKTKKINLLLGPVPTALLVSGCGNSESEAATRDVYQNQDECAKDWDSALCERMADQDEKQYQSSYGTHYPVFWGPMYYPHDRTVVYQGRTISPTSRSSTLPAYTISSRSSSASRTGASSPRSSSITTGGFGSHGTSTSGS